MPALAELSPSASARSSWLDFAACQGMEIAEFYAPAHEPPSLRRIRESRAKAICAACPVRAQCLDHAVRIRERYGIWGGLTGIERRRHFGPGSGILQSPRSP